MGSCTIQRDKYDVNEDGGEDAGGVVRRDKYDVNEDGGVDAGSKDDSK